MRAIVRERPGTDVVAISVATRGGSRDERTETVGAAHFMEHMYFQGTPRRPDAADLDREVEARGGWTNAWTGWESINFQVVAPIDDVDLALDVIADQMVNSLFASEKIDKERKVVLEELNGRLNSPTSKAFDLFLLEVFGDHPAHNLPIGNRSTIDNSTRDVLTSFRDTYFVAGNMAVAVVGDVQHDEIFRKLGQAFVGMRAGPAPPKNSAPVPPLTSSASRPTPRRPSRPGSSSAARRSATTARTATSLDVVEAILGESGRRLERELVDTQAIASSVYMFYYPLTDVGVWGISAGSRPADVDRVMDLAKAELRIAPRDAGHARGARRGEGVPAGLAADQPRAQHRPGRGAERRRGARHIRADGGVPESDRRGDRRRHPARGPGLLRS